MDSTNFSESEPTRSSWNRQTASHISALRPIIIESSTVVAMLQRVCSEHASCSHSGTLAMVRALALACLGPIRDRGAPGMWQFLSRAVVRRSDYDAVSGGLPALCVPGRSHAAWWHCSTSCGSTCSTITATTGSLRLNQAHKIENCAASSLKQPEHKLKEGAHSRGL